MEAIKEFFRTTPYAMSLIFIVGGVVLGVIFESIILGRLKAIAVKTKWRGDDVIVGSLRRVLILWFVLAGLYGAIINMPSLSEDLSAALAKVILIVFVVSVTLVATRIIVGFIRVHSKTADGAGQAASILTNITRLVVFVIGFLIVLQTLGISITPIITALGVGGLAVALALQDTLSNLFAGLHIIASKLVRPGDFVELDTGQKGYVEDITWRNTSIRALQNNMVIVPNSKLASTTITNYYRPTKEMSSLVQVGVDYGSDLEEVERVTTEVGRETLKEVIGGVPDFEPLIRFHTFDSSSINFTVVLRCKEFVDQYLLTHEFIKKLHSRYKKENITIPFPIRTIYTKGEKQN